MSPREGPFLTTQTTSAWACLRNFAGGFTILLKETFLLWRSKDRMRPALPPRETQEQDQITPEPSGKPSSPAR